MHNQASQELSKGKRLSNLAYRNWNTSAYSYNEAKRRYEFKEELGRKPTVKEVAERMGVAEDVVSEALSLSADKIEDINVVDKNN